MSKKLRGIGVQLVGFFVLAILIPTLILAFRAIETTKSADKCTDITGNQDGIY